MFSKILPQNVFQTLKFRAASPQFCEHYCLGGDIKRNDKKIIKHRKDILDPDI